jgi:hypothetical protein
MTPVRVYLDAIAFWAPGIAGWDALRDAMAAGSFAATDDHHIAPECLAPT